MIFFAIFNSLSTPIEIAFKPSYLENKQFLLINVIIDIIFIVDVILNFRTSVYLMELGEEVINPKRIALYYIKTTFWNDIMASIPFDLILMNVPENLKVY